MAIIPKDGICWAEWYCSCDTSNCPEIAFWSCNPDAIDEGCYDFDESTVLCGSSTPKSEDWTCDGADAYYTEYGDPCSIDTCDVDCSDLWGQTGPADSTCPCECP